jgi:hypothetical protein
MLGTEGFRPGDRTSAWSRFATQPHRKSNQRNKTDSDVQVAFIKKSITKMKPIGRRRVEAAKEL